MFLTRLKVAAALLFALAAFGAGTAGLAYRASAEQPAAQKETPPRKQPARHDADKEKAARQRLEKENRELRERLKKMDAKADIAELKLLLMKLERDELKKDLQRRKREIDGVLTRVEIEKNRISLTVGTTRLALERVPLSNSVKFYMGEEECTINDLKPGMAASIAVKTESGKSVIVLIRAHKAKK
jgi:hypothetical protein